MRHFAFRDRPGGLSYLLCLVTLTAFAAEPPIDQMKSQAFFILSRYKMNGKERVASGSGFAVGPKHIVTNVHVCCEAPAGAKPEVAVLLSEKQIIRVKSVQGSANKDLAILELEEALPGVVPSLVTRKVLKEGQDVWAVGYPGASMQVGDAKALFVPSISKGIISKFLASRGSTKDGGPVEQVQITAAVNSGNSGGPLFDGCGRVAGVVVAKALTSLGKNAAFAEGVNLAVMIDELLPELDKAKVPYTVATDACAVPTGSGGGLGALQIATLVAAVMALFIALNKRTRTAVTQATKRLSGHSAPKATPVAAGAVRKMTLRCVSGPFAGQKIPLSAKPCVIGRDPAIANLVFPHDATQVSKKHCQLTCDASGRVLLEDSWSSNGTFTGSGERVTAGRAREMKAGERFYLGSQSNLFEVVAE